MSDFRPRRSPRLKSKTKPVYNATKASHIVDGRPEEGARQRATKATAEVQTPKKAGKTEDDSKDDSKAKGKAEYAAGTNWVHGGIDTNPHFFALICVAPLLCQLLGYVTSKQMEREPHLSVLLPECVADLKQCGWDVYNAAFAVGPSLEALKFLGSFFGVSLLLELLPGKEECGPTTLTGYVPKYTDNGVKHCIVFSFLFWVGSNLGYGDYYDFGIFFDVFPSCLVTLNIFGLLFCVFLTLKGLHFPSTDDCGSSGSIVTDYVWGTELYPRIGGLDIKRFINDRFSMTFWMLAGASFAYRSFTLHGSWDYGLLFSAISQYIYLFKFFWWEMGYMRSIDIIVDRAGFEIQWGCLVYVPAVYTLHTRFLVLHPSGHEIYGAVGLFVLSLLGVLFNYMADAERDHFRATNGQCKVWGADPKFIRAEYTIVNKTTGETETRKSLLLASGFWGIARHFQYLFELIAAWSWCFLANPFVNGVIPLYYATFLTYLLVDRAKRDSDKCHAKYGKYYEEYCRLVPYKIVPGVY